MLLAMRQARTTREKINRSIVGPALLVMDLLALPQSTSEHRFRSQSMLVDVTPNIGQVMPWHLQKNIAV